MWTEYGGSGLGMEFEAVNELDIEDVYDLYDRLVEQRKKEADAIRSASKRPPPTR